MNTLKNVMLIIFLGLFTISVSGQTTKDKKVMLDADDAKKTLLAEDPGLQKMFDNSVGYVIFPNVGKGGLIVGGATGNGVVYEGGKPIGMATLSKVSVGLQAGGQAIIETIFFETKNELEEFKKGKFKLDAGASAVALEEGDAITANYSEGVAIVTHTKGGLMADVSVGGQKFKFKPFK
ncbi:lipid-binding SYLF domain-containing protein [Robertkochia sediminum]|uniref:lipid-binding SYLF domain-containing protein n=1 Tax=Robertkochia sediminum TaxID=2785326 RepID=UPI00193433B7|nr:lipid-binding SYLF domain-containing protein [Robertkochia sediminum]MBL7472902.1 lipid-binding SYLF domain-containing protein [Robertkochia sediminum]